MIRHVLFSSVTRSSWHLGPTELMGRECGNERDSPRCNCRSRNPASSRATRENGGVLTSPCSQTNSLSRGLTVECHNMSYSTYRQLCPWSRYQRKLEQSRDIKYRMPRPIEYFNEINRYRFSGPAGPKQWPQRSLTFPTPSSSKPLYR